MAKEKKHSVVSALRVPLILVGIMWGMHMLNLLFDLNLVKYGIYPRRLDGMKGILFSPFIHSTRDFGHIINNTTPILILGWTLFYFYRKIAWGVLLASWLLGGLFVWIAARDSYHVGMSGIIYSLAFYLFFSGVFRKDVRLLSISLFVVFLYGSMIWGIFPLDASISFESHLLGGVVGLVLAFFLQNEGATFKRKKYQWEIDEELEKEMEQKGYVKKIDDESGFVINYEYKPKDPDTK